MNDVTILHDQSVVRIRLSRPAKKNALTMQMQRSIADALIDADADPAVAVVILEAEGADFCAGNDLAMMAEMAAGTRPVESFGADHFLNTLSRFGKPLIAGVRGRAIGVGATMLLHCDVTIVAHDSRLSFPFVDLSLVPEAASTFLVPAAVGYARAYALLCMTEPMTGAEAAIAGLVTRSVDAADVQAGVAQAAARLVSRPASALAATKRLMKNHDAIRSALVNDKAAFMKQMKDAAASAQAD